MAQYGVVEDPSTVNYETHCCCKTTDSVFYGVPKFFFHLNASIVKRKLDQAKPFPIPLNSECFAKLLILMEQVSVVDVQVGRPTWAEKLGKEEQRFVFACLGISTWEGGNIYLYKEKLPKVGEIVYVKVTQVNDTSATVQLLEYGNSEGIIPYTEVTKRRVRSMGKFIKVGKSEAAQVIRIDEQKGYIDLSKKQVIPAEGEECKARYSKASSVRSVVCHAAEMCKIPAETAMELIAYPLYSKEPGKDAWAWLQELNETKDVERILGPIRSEYDEFIKVLLDTLANMMRRKVLNLSANVDMTCNGFDGVGTIRDVLLIAQNFGEGKEPKINISVMITGPPSYSLRVRTDMKEEGLSRLNGALEAMKAEMERREGQMKITEAPKVLNADDDVDDTPQNSDDEDD